MIRRILSIALTLIVLSAATVSVSAVNTDMSFQYGLSVNGENAATVQPGDIVTVTLTLTRTDSTSNFPMYAIQGNVWYNAEFFELVPDSIATDENSPVAIVTSSQTLSGSWDGWISVSASTYSVQLAGTQWKNQTTMMTFQLKTLKVGTSTIFCRDNTVSTSDGLDSYTVTENNVSVSVKTDKQDSMASGFTDVPANAWYAEAVSYVVNAGLFTGTSSATFAPESNMTRAMLVTALWRLDGMPKPANPNAFSDVNNGQWYTNAILWANENGIVSGYGGGIFGTNDSVTRQQLAVILHRYAQLSGYDTSQTAQISSFADTDAILEWAVDALQWAVGSGIISGTGENALSPSETATRAQVAVMLMRFNNLSGH